MGCTLDSMHSAAASDDAPAPYQVVRNRFSVPLTTAAQVLDTCADGDCTTGDCCTENANHGNGTLLDLEFFTAACLYDGKVGSNDFQAIQWQLA